MAFELSDLNEVPVNFEFLKPDGSPGDIDTTNSQPTLTSSDEAAATGTLAADARSALIRSGDNLPADAPVTFTLTVDVDLGDGVNSLNVQFDMLIKSHTAGQVSTVNVGFGTPTPKS
jgi:hypothetical protein